MALTVTMMTVEIAAGMAFGSMALLADGWHMGTHAAALGIALFAYVYARRHPPILGTASEPGRWERWAASGARWVSRSSPCW